MSSPYPSSIDMMRSTTEHDFRGGWTEIRIDNTFAPYKAPDAAHDGRRGGAESANAPQLVDGRALLSPTDVRHFRVKSGLPGGAIKM